jgi:hypothetical protein
MKTRRKRTKIKMGDKFGRLTILRWIGYQNSHKTYEVRCECGTIKTVTGTHMVQGYIKSCGCLHFEMRSKAPGFAGYSKIFTQYKANARNRKLSFKLTFKKFIEIISQNCYYCGQKPQKKYHYLSEDGVIQNGVTAKAVDRAWIYINGVDRMDNTKGYTQQNSGPCCFECNRAKMDRSSEEFIAHSQKIATRRQQNII